MVERALRLLHDLITEPEAPDQTVEEGSFLLARAWWKQVNATGMLSGIGADMPSWCAGFQMGIQFALTHRLRREEVIARGERDE